MNLNNHHWDLISEKNLNQIATNSIFKKKLWLLKTFSKFYKLIKFGINNKLFNQKMFYFSALYSFKIDILPGTRLVSRNIVVFHINTMGMMGILT